MDPKELASLIQDKDWWEEELPTVRRNDASTYSDLLPFQTQSYGMMVNHLLSPPFERKLWRYYMKEPSFRDRVWVFLMCLSHVSTPLDAFLRRELAEALYKVEHPQCAALSPSFQEFMLDDVLGLRGHTHQVLTRGIVKSIFPDWRAFEPAHRWIMEYIKLTVSWIPLERRGYLLHAAYNDVFFRRYNVFNHAAPECVAEVVKLSEALEEPVDFSLAGTEGEKMLVFYIDHFFKLGGLEMLFLKLRDSCMSARFFLHVLRCFWMITPFQTAHMKARVKGAVTESAGRQLLRFATVDVLEFELKDLSNYNQYVSLIAPGISAAHVLAFCIERITSCDGRPRVIGLQVLVQLVTAAKNFRPSAKPSANPTDHLELQRAFDGAKLCLQALAQNNPTLEEKRIIAESEANAAPLLSVLECVLPELLINPWTCHACTLINIEDDVTCAACGTPQTEENT